MCVVRVVLLCKGRGAEASSYRPNRDETQWTNRRDALVRRVAAFLYGPSASSHATSERELVLIHDEDYSRIEMRFQPNLVPTEQQVLSICKAAAENPGQSINVESGVSCRMVLDKSVTMTASSIPTNMDSKRQVLEYLQQNCSIDFLRKHRLNSSAYVVLRKTNKNALMKVYREWNAENASANVPIKQERLSSIFQELLKPVNASIEKVVAGILHESSESELPCFEVDADEARNLQVCLFLGAVRDMHPWENRVLSSCCAAAQVPLVRVRLGSVSEFTSKILTVVAHHHAQGTLGPALLKLCSKENDKKAATVDSKQANQRLHAVCFMPIHSGTLSCDLRQRSRAMWALVRVTVCTLWRSRLASNMEGDATGASPLVNGLTIVFEDGVDLSLEQDELVKSLAEQHQAAPSEYQILRALCKKRDEAVSARVDDGEWTLASADALLQRVMQCDDALCLPSFVLDSSFDASAGPKHLTASLYSSEMTNPSASNGQLLLLLRIRDGAGEVAPVERVNLLKEACERRGIPVLRESLMSRAVQDEEAATVTMAQHFIYQGILFPALKHMDATQTEPSNDKKRKRKKDHKKKKKKRKDTD
jgi:hypothetical protein